MALKSATSSNKVSMNGEDLARPDSHFRATLEKCDGYGVTRIELSVHFFEHAQA